MTPHLLLMASTFGLLAACSGKDEEKPTPEPVDSDGDGVLDDEDCGPDDAAVFPGNPEVCDGIDQDCDGTIDDGLIVTWYADFDGDGYGDKENAFARCEELDGYTMDKQDCDDQSDTSFPGGIEVCDGHDNDCNGAVDDGLGDYWTLDDDEDGWGSGEGKVQACEPPEGYAETGDCDDSDEEIHPGAIEICEDTLDTDCDGMDMACPFDISDASYARYIGELDLNYSGYTGQGVGDLDGNGVDDIAVGAILYPDPYNPNGALYVVAGPVEAGAHDLGDVYTAKISGDALEGFSGGGIAPVGDVDGDGMDDLAVGSWTYDYSASSLDIWHGPVSGDLASSSADARVTSSSYLALFDDQPESDLTGDGIVDFLVGDPIGSGYAGMVYVVEGPLDGTSDLSGATTILGVGTVLLGDAVSPAGDVDGDGLGDVLASAPYASKYGEAYVIPGGSGSGLSSDVASSTWTPRAASYALGTAIADLGDWNGDGYDDFAVADPIDYTLGFDKKTIWTPGAVFVVYGPAAGTHSVDDADAMVSGTLAYESVGGSIDATDLDGDGVLELMITGTTATTAYGGVWVVPGPLEGSHFVPAYTSFKGDYVGDLDYGGVRSAGDVDGDGTQDMLVASANYPDLQALGVTYLVLGGSF